MKKYEDIYSYYPSAVLNKNISFRDFVIIDMSEAAVEAFDDSFFKKYKEPHLRNFFEIHIGVIEPMTSYISIGSDLISGKNKHVLFASPSRIFSLDYNKHEKVQKGAGYIIAFQPSFLLDKKRTFEILDTYRFFSSHSFPQHIFDSEKLAPLLQLAERMFQEYKKPKEYTREVIGGYMAVLLHLFNRSLKMENEILASNSCEHFAMRFEQSIINDGYKISTVANYASQLNISASYLSECIKKVTGRNAKQIINNHKLIVAKSLLQQKQKSIAEIAFEMNFSEPTNFTKFFKRLTGITPYQFRNG